MATLTTAAAVAAVIDAARGWAAEMDMLGMISASAPVTTIPLGAATLALLDAVHTLEDLPDQPTPLVGWSPIDDPVA